MEEEKTCMTIEDLDSLPTVTRIKLRNLLNYWEEKFEQLELRIDEIIRIYDSNFFNLKQRIEELEFPREDRTKKSSKKHRPSYIG